MEVMSILIGCLLGLVFLSPTIAAEKYEKVQDLPYDQMISQLVAQSVMNFAHNLAMALDTDEYPNTQIFSPLSVMSSLSILQLGSYGNSYNQLNQQLFALLNRENLSSSPKIHEEFGWLLEDIMLDSKNQKRSRNSTEWRSKPLRRPGYAMGRKNNFDNHTIQISNALFIQNGFSLRPDYVSAAQSVYKSEVTPLDFLHKPTQSKDYINSWVKQSTRGIIPTVLDEDPIRETNMILASTLYFRGFWETVFYDVNDDSKEAFYPDGPESSSLKITFMKTGGNFPFYDAIEYNCRIIGFPYKGNQTTMYVIQPYSSTRLSLRQLQANLTGEIINELISKMDYKTAIIAFPKMHVGSKMNLKKPLKRMGIKDIFINGVADLALVADPEENKEEAGAASSSSFLPVRPDPVSQHQDMTIKNTTTTENTLSPSFGNKKSQPSYSDLIDRFGFHQNPDKLPISLPKPPEQYYKTIWVRDGDLFIGTPTLFTRPAEDRTDLKDEILLQKSTIIPSKSSTTKLNPEEKSSPHIHSLRRRRSQRGIAAPVSSESLQKLDQMRSTANLKKPNLYVDEIIHKVDLKINEQGTEAAAATVALLQKSGPDVIMRCDTPYLILIRHDPTKLPLFYGKVNIPI